MDRQRSAWSAYTYAYWDPADLCLRGGLNAVNAKYLRGHPFDSGPGHTSATAVYFASVRFFASFSFTKDYTFDYSGYVRISSLFVFPNMLISSGSRRNQGSNGSDSQYATEGPHVKWVNTCRDPARFEARIRPRYFTLSCLTHSYGPHDQSVRKAWIRLGCGWSALVSGTLRGPCT
jgi:hypothetical protein